MSYADFEELINGSCTDDKVWLAVLARHAISEGRFLRYLSNEYGSTPEAPVVFNVQTMLASSENCKEKSWQYDVEGRNNSKMNLILNNIRGGHEYSIQLFRGLDYWLNANSFEFTFGKDDEGIRFVMFTASDVAGKAIYFGNVISMFP